MTTEGPAGGVRVPAPGLAGGHHRPAPAQEVAAARPPHPAGLRARAEQAAAARARNRAPRTAVRPAPPAAPGPGAAVAADGVAAGVEAAVPLLPPVPPPVVGEEVTAERGVAVSLHSSQFVTLVRAAHLTVLPGVDHHGWTRPVDPEVHAGAGLDTLGRHGGGG